MTIMPKEIPTAVQRDLASAVLKMANSFYENPANEAKFQEWLKTRKEK